MDLEFFKDLSYEDLLHHINLLIKANKTAEVGYWIYQPLNGYLFWSDLVYDIHGVSKESYEPEIESAVDFYHPEDKSRVEAIVNQAMDDGLEYNFSARIVRPDGEIVYVKSIGDVKKNENGQVVELFGTFQDISQAYLNQQRIKESERRFSLATTAGRIAVWDWDIQKDQIFWSTEPLIDVDVVQDYVPRERFLGNIHPEDVMNVISKFDNITEAEDSFDLTYRVLQKNNDYIWVNDKGRAVQFDAQGNALRVVGAAQDITAEKQAEEDLKRSNHDLERFAFIASHDMREPMRTISSFVDLFKEDFYEELNEKGKKYLDFIHDAASRMTDMINDLLMYSRVTRKNVVTDPYNFNDLVEDVAKGLNALIVEKEVNLQLEDSLQFQININKSLISQLIQNLIVNAIRYVGIGQKPFIKIYAEETLSNFIIYVQDNGTGIDKEYFDKIFDLFYRLDKEENVKGTGMGLATCRRIVDLWRGYISLESERGKGSTFFFTVPKSLDQERLK